MHPVINFHMMGRVVTGHHYLFLDILFDIKNVTIF